MINLCRMFSCLPSQLYEEGAEILRMVNVYARGHREKEVSTDG